MLKRILFIVFTIISLHGAAQPLYIKDSIQSNNAKKVIQDKLFFNIGKFSDYLDTFKFTNDEEQLEALELMLWEINQYSINNKQIERGIHEIMKNYDTLPSSFQSTMLELIYGLYPQQYYSQIYKLIPRLKSARDFAIASQYIFNKNPTKENYKYIVQASKSLITNARQQWLIKTLLKELNADSAQITLPSFDSLFAWQHTHGFKIIYSFQRKNRLYHGLAVLQNADGSFYMDSSNQIATFPQLAKSASGLPYYISNGNTPQGIYSIKGTAISRNSFLGPTPNIQTKMMYEVDRQTFSHNLYCLSDLDSSEYFYRRFVPPVWQNWCGLMNAFDAGKIGRSEIIIHGSVMDKRWSANKSYAPFIPTLGCLTGLEIWDEHSGKLSTSTQLDLVNAFASYPDPRGFLIVIDLDNKPEPVTFSELMKIINKL